MQQQVHMYKIDRYISLSELQSVGVTQPVVCLDILTKGIYD